MSGLVKGILEPGLGDPFGISGGGGSKDPRKATGGQRRKIVESRPEGKRHFMPDKESWADYVGYLQKSPEPRAPEPITFEMPSFEMPDYSSMFQRPQDARQGQAEGKTVAERLKEEAAQFAKVKAGEEVYSAAQGVSTRLRAAVNEDEEGPGGGTRLGDSARTLLGRRGQGGATSFRRQRISRY